MNHKFLEPANLIVRSNVEEPKIYIREQFGTFQKTRRYLSWALMITFIVIPLFRYQGQQAVLFNVEQQTLQLFSLIFFPQDLFIFSLVFAFAAFGLFHLTRLYGRVWCGFTCPQTVWMLMFNWLERRIEGTANQSKQLDKANWTIEKVGKKLLKHFSWLVVSLLTSLVFISYFIPVERLYLEAFTLNSSGIVAGWVVFFMLCTYINAAWIREKMCQHMCPYSRFQSAMFNKATKLVTYDASRGEARGKRKRGLTKSEGMGDCVDCNLCVEVCPVGIDIRQGLQYECINCGLCADACDQTMDKFSYSKGLISFKQQQASLGWRQYIGYGSGLLLLLASMAIWAANWKNLDVSITRDRNELYRINQLGEVENTYVVKIRNKALYSQMVSVSLSGTNDIKLDKQYQLMIAPKELKIVPLVAVLSNKSLATKQKIEFTIKSEQTRDVVSKHVAFYAGSGGWK